MIRIALGIICVTAGIALGGYGSALLAGCLFRVNAPKAHAVVKSGWGFSLSISLLAGGIMGALTATGVASSWLDYCIYCGAVTAIILLILMRYFSDREFWEGPDLLALPLLLAIVLLGWGIYLKRS